MLLKSWNLLRGKTVEPAPEPEADEDRRIAPRRPIFREALLAIEDYYKIRCVITDLSESGARVHYSTRIDLPSRVMLSEPTMKLKCWSRVAWQHDGAAGLEFITRE